MLRQFLFILSFLCISILNAQTLEELKAKRADLEKKKAEKMAEAQAFNSDLNRLNSEIEIMRGWRTGYSGTVGFDFNKSNNWISNPNSDSKAISLNVGFTGFANRKKKKYFWNNKVIISKSWQDLDLSDPDGQVEEDGLFDNSTVDLVNISTLFGHKLSDKFAVSGLNELNSSIENFLNPGTWDMSLGSTWTPSDVLIIVVHPVNYHLAFSGVEGVDTRGEVGAKVRADYGGCMDLNERVFKWSSTFTMFVPYSKAEDTEPTLFEFTWLNSFSYELWKGLRLGFNFGIRNAEFESENTQSFYSLGLSYAL